ncbi:hypothetical protein AVEN_122022-1 [Araneus ventricosus]|uniref:Uncharacterized protein n=1 Tax=Araneus ventricosus TaxID=182803 RepID=A0A4Y2VDQ0_ARAVE|nr:hypothetical protein AVEN_246673-1 [Araneus ventricosus]GBO22835.1 hypothetical protein AVEN_122022-1 [Araneus ventricosus]
MKKKLSFVLKVDEAESDDTESDIEKRKKNEEIKTKCDDIDWLVELMKVKLNSNLSKREKIQILTIAPQSWSRKIVALELNVTEFMAQKARDLTLEKGILAIPGSRTVNKNFQEAMETDNFFMKIMNIV